MGFEISYGYFGGISSVTPGGYQFVIHVVFLGDQFLHLVGDLVVKNVFSWGDASLFESKDELFVGPC